MKHGYTLVEGLISMALISLITLCSVTFITFHNKNALLRNTQTQALTNNIDTIERLRAEVDSVEKLIDFMDDNNVKAYAIGFGEVAVVSGALTIINSEGYGFTTALISTTPHIFRVEMGGDIPNSKVSTILRI